MRTPYAGITRSQVRTVGDFPVPLSARLYRTPVLSGQPIMGLALLASVDERTGASFLPTEPTAGAVDRSRRRYHQSGKKSNQGRRAGVMQVTRMQAQALDLKFRFRSLCGSRHAPGGR